MKRAGATGDVTVDVTTEAGLVGGGVGALGRVAACADVVGRGELVAGAGRAVAGRSAERDGPAAEESLGAAVGDAGACRGVPAGCGLASGAGPPAGAANGSAPPRSMRRSRLLPVSMTITSPSPVTATSRGWAILAAVAGPPSPPKEEAPVPATVRISPVRRSTARIRSFIESAM